MNELRLSTCFDIFVAFILTRFCFLKKVTQFKQMADNSRLEMGKLYELLKARKTGSEDLSTRMEVLSRENLRLSEENSQLQSTHIVNNEKCLILEKEVEKLQKEVEDFKNKGSK
jgi:hypothetical protein